MAMSDAYYLISRVRSLNYFAEYSVLRALDASLNFFKRSKSSKQTSKGAASSEKSALTLAASFKILERELNSLFRADAENIGRGLYPASVLIAESPTAHLKRLPLLLIDGIRVNLRRGRNETKTFNAKAESLASGLPDYYKRNFHFQTDGYLSEGSAELYEHQVELLFAGSADAMRRLIIEPMKEVLKSKTGEGLTFLEVAGGTGRASHFVKLAFPKAKIVVSDISAPYLKVAQRKLHSFENISYVEAAGEDLPFKDVQFDAVYSVFLFHELPFNVRQGVIEESRRVLKPKGFLGAIDSIQFGDEKVLDPILENFPREFHEPFYKNYLQNPMEELLSSDGDKIQTHRGFLSKVVWTQKS